MQKYKHLSKKKVCFKTKLQTNRTPFIFLATVVTCIHVPPCTTHPTHTYDERSGN